MNYIYYIKKLWRYECNISESYTSEITRNLLNEEPISNQVSSKQNISLDVDDLTFLKKRYPFNPILGYLNINSLRNKIEALRIVLNKAPIDISAISGNVLGVPVFRQA